MTYSDEVTVQVEDITIPTYTIDAPNKNPMFLETRVYQGSSGAVYPHPIVERVFDEKVDRTYTAIFLENAYLKIMLLPELGGRIQMAQDKTTGYHFTYYNRVIKPALVGLTGPWISGGIEFNWPQHHRPSTFEPVDYTIQPNENGSKTVWLGEIERMFRTKALAGVTLYPGRAYIEIKVQLYNRTDVPQTFLWWANPAVHANERYQSVFPPDVYAVMDHGKRDVSSFPIATGTYYKVDYSPGTDISWYKNIPVPMSYMAYHSNFDFVGCYDHGAKAGMLHIADHHVVPGKKQWTWGSGDFGRAWERQLTDEDGPYVELMCGAFTDNQPDFSWLQPGEEKSFTQVFMPYKHIGPPKNANKDAALSLDIENSQARIGVYVTRPRQVRIELLRSGHALLHRTISLTPETAFEDCVELPSETNPQQLTLRVLDSDAEILSFSPLPNSQLETPLPATAALAPQDIASNEELFLNGLHLEQYRHASYPPEPYYEEAIRRDPFDSLCNNALGLLLQRRGKFAEAEPYFRKAIASLTRRNPNPYNGEPFYNLGLSLKMQERYAEAYDAFYKSVWNAAYQACGYFELARIACRNGQLDTALDHLENAMTANWRHHQTRHLKVAMLRRTGRCEEAIQFSAASLELDVMNVGVLYERHLLTGDGAYRSLMREYVHNYIEISLDYAHAGLYDEAIALLKEAPRTDPMVLYYLGWFCLQVGDDAAVRSFFEQARALSPDYCFPNRVECVGVLKAAMEQHPGDARAPYYLGNFWYAKRQYDDAITCWEHAAALDRSFATVQRNLGLAYMNKRHDPQRAFAAYQEAFRLDSDDARVFFELDQLHKRIGTAPVERLTHLERYGVLVDQRDDLTIERINLLNLEGRHEDALQILLSRTFHPWEGGEGKVTRQYVISLIQLAKRHIQDGQYERAIELLDLARAYPLNLGEGKLAITPENHIEYFLGCAYEGLGDIDAARQHFEQACVGSYQPSSPLYYNDQPPDMIFYQGLAQAKLDNRRESVSIFERLLHYGEERLNDTVIVDYFAVSLPDFLVFEDDLNQRNAVHCHYMMALGYLGLGDKIQAEAHFERILKIDPCHLGATIHNQMNSTRALLFN